MAEGAFGMKLSYKKDGGVYAELGEITEITPPAITRDLIETTSHASQNKTYLGGLVDFGEVSCTFNYDPDGTDDVAFRDLAGGGTTDGGGISANPANYSFKIEYNDAGDTTEEFNGIVTGFETSTPIDGQISATVTIKVSGSVTYA
tara:strand:- start:111 stop:548 length:438 start_codon:yes stop_codon:yes gene_type:complete